MQAVLYSDWETLEMADLPAPTAGPGEVLLKVAAAGVCGSELEAFRKRSPRRQPPLVMGHEFCGTVAAVGEGVAGFAEGQPVVSNSLVGCGECVRCRRGDAHLCAGRQLFGMHRPGAFAEYVAVPAAALLPWPDGLPARAAAMAEPMANGVHMVRLTERIRPETVLVIGAGPIGLLAMQAFRALTGATVYIADRHTGRLGVGATLGAARTIDAGSEDVVEVVRAATGGEGADVVIDAVGGGATKRQAVDAARPGGAAVWIGLHEDTITLDSFQVTLPERQVLGTYAASLQDMRDALDLMATGRVDAETWTQAFPLSEGDEAFRRMLNPGPGDVKAVILPEGAA
jgi:L-iditol 2-dehydrogenase